MTKILLTGATGHAGSVVVEQVLNNTDWEIISLERLREVGSMDRMAYLNIDARKDRSRFRRLHHDFRAALPSGFLREEAGKIDFILHNGAEVRAIRSLTEPGIFVQSNVIGTFNMLEAARVLKPKKFVYTSSAEVLGPARDGISHGEESALLPSNPYSASKAGGEMLVRAYHRSFAVPTIIVRTMNIFGERQQTSKSVPRFLKEILNNQTVPLHVDSTGKSGTRQWMYVHSYVDALRFILDKAAIGEAYHVAGEEKSNHEIANRIAEIAKHKLEIELVNVDIHHKAHDLRYSISDDKLRNLGWVPPIGFDEGIKKTVNWTMQNLEWLE